MTSAYSKVKAHLLKIRNQGVEVCSKVDDDCLRQLKKEVDDAETRKKDLALSAKQKSNYITLPECFDLTQPKKRKGPLDKLFDVSAREQADKTCAMMFYTGLLSFNFSRNSWFR